MTSTPAITHTTSVPERHHLFSIETTIVPAACRYAPNIASCPLWDSVSILEENAAAEPVKRQMSVVAA
jgi:hypothetical protein